MVLHCHYPFIGIGSGGCGNCDGGEGGGGYHRSSHGGAPSLSMCRPKMGHWVDLAE